MNTGSAPRFIALLVVGFGVACGSSSEPTVSPLPLAGGSYTVSVAGDVRASLQGTPLALKSASGYKEADATGQLQSTGVILIQLTPVDPTQPRLVIGLLGPIQPGAYTVRAIAHAEGLGTRPELYALIVLPGSEGTNNFSATSGTVTLAAAGDTLRGTLSLHYGTVAHVPLNASMSLPVTGANVDATGSFAVAAPLTAQR